MDYDVKDKDIDYDIRGNKEDVEHDVKDNEKDVDYDNFQMLHHVYE